MKLQFDSALLADGWIDDAVIEIDDEGTILAAGPKDTGEDAHYVAGIAVPGVANVHSHAFQRAMAGLTERAGPSEDSFWTWRELMYAFAARLTPDDLSAIAAQLYVEMLRTGYTAVGEFHYVHHQPDGTSYADPAELSERVINAAKDVGIAITHLPVLYAYGNFGGVPPSDGQKRFLHDADSFLRLVETLRSRHFEDARVNIGIAPHSLRAVTPELLAHVVEELHNLDPAAPIHIHIAEQTKEVEDCVAWSGARPVEWLLRHQAVDMRWCLVHATHLAGDEVNRMASSRAVAGLCPTTEANLGDGVFPAKEYIEAGGRIGIGSDSHASVDMPEELRLLEYGQRLTHRQRNVLAGAPEAATGARLFAEAATGGAQALGQPIGKLAPGLRADLVVLDADSPALYGRTENTILDSLVFAGLPSPVRHVYVAGRQVIADGHHAQESAIADNFRRAMDRLLAA